MKKKKTVYTKITDDMIGRDEKICKCSSTVADLIAEASKKFDKDSMKNLLAELQGKTLKSKRKSE